LEEKGFLLYCIIDQDDDNLIELIGLDDVNHLLITEYKGLYGVYSHVNLSEYGEETIKLKGEDLNWIAEHACKFMSIIQLINEAHHLIPMKFLSIFNSEARIQAIIEENYDSLKLKLQKLKGCEEYSVKIYYDHNVFKETEMVEEIESFERSLAEKPIGAAFFLKKKFDCTIDEAVQNKVFKIANSIIESIETTCIEIKSNKLLAKEITGVKDKMIMNYAFLINNTQKNDFINLINEIKDQYQKCGIKIECSGPWPPYNFC